MSAADRVGPMVFVMRSPAYVRNFEWVLRDLVRRGHLVTVLFEERKIGGDRAGLALIEQLCEEYDGLRYELLPPLPAGRRGVLRLGLQAAQDYMRYIDAGHGDAPKLRARVLAFLPSPLERGIAGTLSRFPRGRRVLAAACRRAAARLGHSRAIREELERRRPRVLIVTPMVHFRSRQSEWVRTAHHLGIRTMLCVFSWDNLTTKGLVHVLPDRVAVWNEDQRRQAVELHGVPPESIVVAGAWPYDHWFGWQASRSRAQLCRQLGLPADRALILYVCSSRFIAARERGAVVRWVEALRASSDPRVASANIIIRPHPLNSAEWVDCALAGLSGVAVFPPGGADPVDLASRTDYFDSLEHADAVVGVNTSALIESAIVDRPALAFPAPDFRSSQEELPHFRQLADEQGVLQISGSMDEHVELVGRALADATAGAAARGRFVKEFVRPRGDSPSPTEVLVAALEELLGTSGEAASASSPPVARQ
jgi:hypothetical protein